MKKSPPNEKLKKPNEIVFKIWGTELEKLNEWMANRPNPKAYTGAIGGRYSYRFCPTSLGTVIKVIDSHTKEEYDITDYDGW